MADPLSIAGSVVGITAAGVQASVKLYALAEKVATASQRVTSIADDISSTCAILNQVRELIVPQPDAQGTLKSVFNSAALNDISHALQRCRSVFAEIGILLHRAFEQVGKRTAFYSKIELSRFEKAKWPFLQPQFDDLRTDLRDSKGNLVLMIAVASLALARRDGRQRSVHDGERLELGSTIVQLQRALTMKAQDTITSSNHVSQKMGLRKLFGKRGNVETNGYTTSERSRGMSSEHMSGSRGVLLMQASSPKPRQNVAASSVIGNRVHGVPPTSARISPANASSAPIGDTRTQEQGEQSRLSPSVETTDINPAVSASMSGSRAPARLLNPDSSDPHHELLPPGQIVPLESMASEPILNRPSDIALFNTFTATPSAASPKDPKFRYQGWTTNYLEGLTTGHGSSLLVSEMDLSHRSLKRLVMEYDAQDLDPDITMLELTEAQRDIIRETCSTKAVGRSKESSGIVVYITVQRDITVSSVFGVLNITTLRWIVCTEVYSTDQSLQINDTLSLDMLRTVSEQKDHIIASRISEDDYYLSPVESTSPTPPTPAPTTENNVKEQMSIPDGWSEYDEYDEYGVNQEPTRNSPLVPPPMLRHERLAHGGGFEPSNRKPVFTYTHCGGGNYEAHRDSQLGHWFIGQDPQHDNERNQAPAPRPEHQQKIKGQLFTMRLPRFRRQRNMAEPPRYYVEVNEEVIVNELLARWTTS